MASRTDNLGHLEEQVSEVTHLLKNNVEKVVERGERIDVLQSRSEGLQASSSNFSRRATQVRRTMCWQNFRLNCIIALVVLGIIVVIIIVVLVEVKPWEKSENSGNNGTKQI
ncbi:vesicle-associated membrane protein 4-like [Pomacea canaliculata]|uniref:vesicle-associated membrane protein 4-like n=1 Tax=Pomacea canaliculata TaxID=400727 RepID=UPI000D730E19|nr:vesicle-associated membrane protein 4-like [Pomacea canaliculata]